MSAEAVAHPRRSTDVGPSGPDIRTQLETVIGLARDLAGQFTLDPLLHRILLHALNLLRCESGSICTVDEAAATYRKEVDLGVGCHSGQTFPLSEGVTGQIVVARGPVVFRSYSEVPKGHLAGREHERIHAVVGVPIMWKGDIIGSCVVFSEDPERLFTDSDVRLLELFASHAAIAIMNATLHMTATERAREAAVMAERERVYRDVHDTVARALGDVLLRLDAVERSGAERSHDIIRAKRAARDALTETRRTVLGLAPSGLDTDALIDAIRLELTWAESAAGLKSDLTIVGVRQPMPATVGYQLFRIVKEALTNVVEHARASRMRVGIVYGQAKITMLIEDDGCGFDLQAIQPQPGGPSFRGLGLQGLVARAHHVGGEVHIESTPGWGTHLRVEMPLAENPQSVRQGGDRWRVLVAHERPIVRAGLVRMLATAEPEIQVVGEITRTDEAVDACALLRPNVLLADLDGSAIDGVRLSSYIRSSSPDVAVVLLVGSFDDVDVQDAARNGAAAFVSRDAEATELTRAVVAAARRDAFVTTLPTVTDPHDDNSRPRLTPREREVRRLVEQGLQDKQIARELSISIKTVEKHVGSILRKTGAANRTTLARESSRRRD